MDDSDDLMEISWISRENPPPPFFWPKADFFLELFAKTSKNSVFRGPKARRRRKNGVQNGARGGDSPQKFN